jgi:DNA-binding MltR family transcriptional regulator
MHHDEIRLLDRFVQGLCYRSQDERVADSVEPILAQTIRLGDFLVDWVCAYGFGDSLVERRVEKSDASDFGEL